jgi:uncharacterized protein with PQ loop repeat
MSGILINSLYAAEPLFTAVPFILLLRSKDSRRFRALSTYFVLHIASFLILLAVLHGSRIAHLSQVTAYSLYFYTYWPLYIAGAISIFFVILELFKFALEPLPGLKRLGLVAFRWVACVSCVAALAVVIAPRMRGSHLLLGACDQLMRCESIFLLSLLFFLMIAAGRLGLSYRSRVFGIAFGFGIMATSNLVASAFLFNFNHNNIRTTAISIMDTGASLLALVIWSAYFLLREPVRRPVTLPVTSPLVRWNDIAIALTPAASRPTFATSTSDFFLQDVEQVVERILIKNSLNAAS